MRRLTPPSLIRLIAASWTEDTGLGALAAAGGLLWAESGDVVALALFGLGDAFHAGAGGWMGGGGGGGGAPLKATGGGGAPLNSAGGGGGPLNGSGGGMGTGICSADPSSSLSGGGVGRGGGGGGVVSADGDFSSEGGTASACDELASRGRGSDSRSAKDGRVS